MGSSAGLVGTVADAIAEVGLGAVADGVAGLAAEARTQAKHVVDASLSAGRQVAEALGHGEASTDSEEGN